MRKTLSSCLIVKNEIGNIKDLISDLLQVSDEIIVNDTGSTDGTLEFLQSHPRVKVIQTKWINDFAYSRNISFKFATCDWIFWCDADDRLSKELIQWINYWKDLGTDDTEYNSILLNYEFGPNCPVVRRRILKRSDTPHWEGQIHEYVYCDNDVSLNRTDVGDIVHHRKEVHTTRNLSIFINKICNNEDLYVRDYLYYGFELEDFGFYDAAFNALNVIIKDLHGFELFHSLNKMFRACNATDSLEKFLPVAKQFNPHELRPDVLLNLGWSFNAAKDYYRSLKIAEIGLDNLNKSWDNCAYNDSSLWVQFHQLMIDDFLSIGNKQAAIDIQDMIEKSGQCTKEMNEHNRKVIEDFEYN